MSNLENLKKLHIESKVGIDPPGWIYNLPNLNEVVCGSKN